MTRPGQPGVLQLVAIAVLAGSVLAFEVVLLRLFEFSHWHHFAGLTIALALLGFGAAGTTLSLLGRRTANFGNRWLLAAMLLTAIGFWFVVLLHTRVALRPLFAAWDMAELGRLLLVDFAAFIPFYTAGLALGQVFSRWPDAPGRLYAANLAGSGIGTVAGSLMLASMLPETAIVSVAAMLLLLAGAFALAVREFRAALLAGVLIIPGVWLIADPPQSIISDFKALPQSLDLPDAEVVARQTGLAGRLTVVRSASQRYAPGLSLNWTGSIPAADAAIVGSDRMIAMSRDFSRKPDFAQASLGGLALSLRPGGVVAALGSGTWSTPALAGERHVHWVEPDKRLLELGRARGFAGRAVVDSPHRYLATTGQSFSVISVDYAYDGADASSEDYLLTRSGLSSALERLEPDGLMAIPLTADYPPRQGPRLLATLAGSLAETGSERPGDHVAVLRGMRSQLVLASPEPLSNSMLQRIREFAGQWSFDHVWHRGLEERETNRHHMLDEPAFYRAAQAVFDGTEMPAAARWFETDPASAARPYFWRTLQWSRLPEMFSALGRAAAGHVDWTLLISAVALIVAVLVSAALIVLPLGRMPRLDSLLGRLQVAGYFGLLGVGFMLVELAILQRSVAFVPLPVLAATVIFAIFMIGAGIGSAKAPTALSLQVVLRIFGFIALFGLVAVTGLWGLMQPLLTLPEAARIVALCALLLPLTWSLGRPFPWGLARLAGTPQWLPWSWALNGFASVVAASLATLVSVQAGQPVTLATGFACYAGVGVIAICWSRR